MNLRKSVFAITLFTEDLAASKSFYQRAFGTPVHFENEDSVVFKFGPTLINVLMVENADDLIERPKIGGGDTGVRAMYTTVVDDVEAHAERLRGAGVEFRGPITQPWGPRAVYFQDPAGHLWEIAQFNPPA